MNATKLLLHLGFFAFGLSAAAQTWQKVAFPDVKSGSAFGVRFELRAPDSLTNAQVWEGPLSITTGTSTCQPDASLIRSVYQSRDGHTTLVVSISGSSTFVSSFNTSSCAQQWRVIKAYTEGASIRGTRLQVLPACECPGDNKPCTCSAGSIYKLYAGKPPTLLTRESRAFTKDTLGIAFTGTRDISNPPAIKLPQAWQP